MSSSGVCLRTQSLGFVLRSGRNAISFAGSSIAGTNLEWLDCHGSVLGPDLPLNFGQCLIASTTMKTGFFCHLDERLRMSALGQVFGQADTVAHGRHRKSLNPRLRHWRTTCDG